MLNGPVPPSRHNMVALDGLRGLAILSVMLVHATPPGPGTFFKQLVRLGFIYGWVGVDLFFVLSGFLITGILLDTRESTNYFQSFYIRRALRIFPLYYAFLLLAWLVFPYTVRSGWMPLRADWWLYPTYLMNWQVLWKDVWHANILGHFWSLAVEEQFYLFWPLVVLALRPRRLLYTLACAEIFLILGRSWWVFHHGPSVMLYTATITRMDSLLFGSGCAVAVRHYRFPQKAVAALPWFSVLGLATFLAVAQSGNPQREQIFTQSVGWSLLALSFAAIVLYAVITDTERSRLQTWLRWRPLTQLGKYSYGIYVFHFPLFYFVYQGMMRLPDATRTAWWLHYPAIPFEFALSFGVARLSYNFFEKRFLALKGRFEPRYRKAPSLAVGGAS